MDKVNELTQALIDATAAVQVEQEAHDALLDEQAAARTTYRALLKKQRDGKLSEEEGPELEMAEKAVESYDERLSAQRKLIAQAEAAKAKAKATLDDEKTRLAVETAAA
ncbi:hypothetical protein LCGC14_2095300, partial [marine sediment metagenome]